MTPIKLKFSSGQWLTVYSEDPDSFSQTFIDSMPPEISELEIDESMNEPPKNLQEVKLTLCGGTTVLCNMVEDQMPKARHIPEIVDCDKSTAVTYGKLARQEAELDAKFIAATQVINNVPDLGIRLHLHREFLKRKAAYVSALEALVDSVMRRPEE